MGSIAHVVLTLSPSSLSLCTSRWQTLSELLDWVQVTHASSAFIHMTYSRTPSCSSRGKLRCSASCLLDCQVMLKSFLAAQRVQSTMGSLLTAHEHGTKCGAHSRASIQFCDLRGHATRSGQCQQHGTDRPMHVHMIFLLLETASS